MFSTGYSLFPAKDTEIAKCFSQAIEECKNESAGQLQMKL